MNDRDSIIQGFDLGPGVSIDCGATPPGSTEAAALPKRPNDTLMQTLARIAIIHERMDETPGDRTEEYIREARGGGMYGTGK